jgi:hypothetical protein
MAWTMAAKKAAKMVEHSAEWKAAPTAAGWAVHSVDRMGGLKAASRVAMRAVWKAE